MASHLVPTKTGPIERLFNDEWRLPDLFDDWRLPDLFRGMGRLEPEIKIEEFIADGKLTVRAEAPGIDPDKDVEITLSNGKLYLSVERHESTETKDNGSTRSEFRYGSFRRTLVMPEGTKPNDIKASYKDGILEVKIPVPASSAKTVKVPISHN